MIIWPPGRPPEEQVSQLARLWVAGEVIGDFAIFIVGVKPEHREYAEDLWRTWDETAARDRARDDHGGR